MDERCILELCDPDAVPLGEALQLARQVSAADSAFVPHLSAFLDYLCGYTYPDPRVIERALVLMRAVSDERSFARRCEQLERRGNPLIAALIRWIEAGAERRVTRAQVPLAAVVVAHAPI